MSMMGNGWKQSGPLPEWKKTSKNGKGFERAVLPASQGAKKKIRGFETHNFRKPSKKAVGG